MVSTVFLVLVLVFVLRLLMLSFSWVVVCLLLVCVVSPHFIKGNTEEELPEVVLGGVRINALDLMAAERLEISAPTPGQQ